MYMRESEIVSKFRKADNRREMLQILADLNGCSRDDMRVYLLEHGVTEEELPKKRRRSKAARKEASENSGEEGKTDMKSECEEIMPGITEHEPEEQGRTDRARAIPGPVRRAVNDRIDEITVMMNELENELDCLSNFLEGVVLNDAG